MTTNQERKKASLYRKIERQVAWQRQVVEQTEWLIQEYRTELIGLGVAGGSVDTMIETLREPKTDV